MRIAVRLAHEDGRDEVGVAGKKDNNDDEAVKVMSTIASSDSRTYVVEDAEAPGAVDDQDGHHLAEQGSRLTASAVEPRRRNRLREQRALERVFDHENFPPP